MILETILGLLDFGVLLLFGMFTSAIFTDVVMNKKNIIILLLFSAGIIILQSTSYFLFGMPITEKLYPLISHLPIVLLLVLYYKKRMISSIFAVMSAYLCCQIGKWGGILAREITGEQWAYYALQAAVTVLLFLLILKHIASAIALILTKPCKIILIFGILPVAYYLFDYSTTVYSDLLYRGSQTVFEFLPFLFSIAFLVFCVLYFKEYEQKRELQHQKQLIELQTAQTIREIEEIRRSEYEISLIRHDMRHFLSNILTYIECENPEQAKEYIHQMIQTTDHTVVQKYCKNQLVNMVLSSYSSRLTDLGIKLDLSVEIPQILPCSEVEFTSILSNGLENAMQAVAPLQGDQKIIILRMNMSGDKLLLSIKNPYDKKPDMIDGIPVSHEEGHGFGTQSIRYVTERLGGNCQFVAENGMFSLRVVL